MLIRKSSKSDFDAIASILNVNLLPTDDIKNASIEFMAIEIDNHVVACGALEKLIGCCLLRSVAVDEHHRKKGYAGVLTSALLEEAHTNNFGDVFLLTNDADGYFEKHGFVHASRETAPVAIKQSRQFSELCPDSAILMKHKVV